MLGGVGWWGRGGLLRKAEVAHVPLHDKSDVGARGVCHYHHHLGHTQILLFSVIGNFSLKT